jgi:2-keto-4-pentenoate hydratase/2-oxohepta-3-ene-1,7-dioic acid hydratase in catechol pathway
VTLLAPIPQPPQMRDFLCFEKHPPAGLRRRRQAARHRGAHSEDLVRAADLLPSQPLQRLRHRRRCALARYSERMDFELEFGCYIGKPGKDIPRERAREHIFGYTVFNDFSARDEQTPRDDGHSSGPAKARTSTTPTSWGPCLVTADELGRPYNLDMKVRVNGEEWGCGNSRDMHWKFEDCIAHVSRSETLHPGEFFGSGTVGNGCGLEHMKFLKPGDVVELEVEKIGTLRNRVVR